MAPRGRKRHSPRIDFHVINERGNEVKFWSKAGAKITPEYARSVMALFTMSVDGLKLPITVTEADYFKNKNRSNALGADSKTKDSKTKDKSHDQTD